MDHNRRKAISMVDQEELLKIYEEIKERDMLERKIKMSGF